MTDDREDTDAGVPDSDPRHLDPAGDLADLFESGDLRRRLDVRPELGIDGVGASVVTVCTAGVEFSYAVSV